MSADTNTADDRPWEPLNGRQPRVGDEVRMDHGVRYVRRAIQKLPVKPSTVIVANDGHEAIEATAGGITWRAREAVLDLDGMWHGVWSEATKGRWSIGFIAPECITDPTWKVDAR